MKAVLITHGSTGDTLPVIAAAKWLLEEGWEVKFLVSPAFQDWTAAHLPETAIEWIPPDTNGELTAMMTRLTRHRNNLHLIKAMYEEVVPGLPQVVPVLKRALSGADLLVVSSLFPFYRSLAEERGIPTLALHFCHNSLPTGNRPPDRVPALPDWTGPMARWWSGFWWKASNQLLDHALNRVAGAGLVGNGLAPVRDWLTRPADYSAFLVSLGLFAPPEAQPVWRQVIGYTELKNGRVQADPKIVEKVRDRVLIHFGSVSTGELPKQLKRFVDRADPQTRFCLQKGWAPLETPETRNFTSIGAGSHETIFPVARIIVHHGGAGTTAAALRAGVPQVIIPFFADQPFWASEVERIGCGLRLSRDRWPDQLTGALQAIDQRPSYREKASRAAQVIAGEDTRSALVAFCNQIVSDQQTRVP